MSATKHFPDGRRPIPKQPAPRGRLWVVVLAPFTSRGQFSPRLLMAWVFAGMLLWLIRRWITTEPQVLAGVLVPVRDIGEIAAILAGLVTALLGMGTFQKVKLGDAAPAPGENNASPDGQPQS